MPLASGVLMVNKYDHIEGVDASDDSYEEVHSSFLQPTRESAKKFRPSEVCQENLVPLQSSHLPELERMADHSQCDDSAATSYSVANPFILPKPKTIGQKAKLHINAGASRPLTCRHTVSNRSRPTITSQQTWCSSILPQETWLPPAFIRTIGPKPNFKIGLGRKASPNPITISYSSPRPLARVQRTPTSILPANTWQPASKPCTTLLLGTGALVPTPPHPRVGFKPPDHEDTTFATACRTLAAIVHPQAPQHGYFHYKPLMLLTQLRHRGPCLTRDSKTLPRGKRAYKRRLYNSAMKRCQRLTAPTRPTDRHLRDHPYTPAWRNTSTELTIARYRRRNRTGTLPKLTGKRAHRSRTKGNSAPSHGIWTLYTHAVDCMYSSNGYCTAKSWDRGVRSRNVLHPSWPGGIG